MNRLDDVLEQARRAPACQPVVAGANHSSTLEAIAAARRHRLAEQPILVGPEDEIRDRLQKRGETPADYRIVSAPSGDPARRAVECISDSGGDILLKGGISTSSLLSAVLADETGLDTGRRLSDILVTDYTNGGLPRLLGVADGGVNVAPDIGTKCQIIENAVDVFHRLGVETPRVAVVCAVERVYESMPHTVDARRLAEMSHNEKFQGCIVDGPLALDNALCPKAARAKDIDSPVAGRADILVVPTIEAGNILGKAFQYLAGKRVAHLIGGARVPVLIPSRTEDAADRLRSIALAVHCRKERR